MALSREHGIIIGVVLLGGLSFMVYRQAKHDEQLGSTNKVDLPEVKGTDDLDKIEITNGDKGAVTLAKDGDKWTATSSSFTKVPASANNVKMLLENIKELKATEMVASNADDAVKASYNLDASHAIHFVGYKGADKKVDDFFGKSGGRGEMMMVNGKPDIIGASGFSSFLYSREPKDWREHDLIKYNGGDAVSVTIENKNAKIACAKTDDKWSCTADGKPIPSFDDSKPANVATSLAYVITDDFPPPDKTVADAGLDKPEGVITVGVKDGAKYTLKVGGPSTGTSHWAQREGDPAIYSVNTNVSEWAMCKIDKFQKSADAGAPVPTTAASMKLPQKKL
jgi:hypothetical protein